MIEEAKGNPEEEGNMPQKLVIVENLPDSHVEALNALPGDLVKSIFKQLDEVSPPQVLKSA